MDKVVCICSFPKSGNTWFRHILSALYDRSPIERFIPDAYQDPMFLEGIEIGGDRLFFFKSHAKSHELAQSLSSRPVDHTIYIVRHPLDVFCSQLNYISDNVTALHKDYMELPCESADSVLASGCMAEYFSMFVAMGTLIPNFTEAGNWFSSAEGWATRRQQSGDATIIRYEDMIVNPALVASSLKDVLHVDEDVFLRAISMSNEFTGKDGKFFWKKSFDTYKGYLTPEMIDRFFAVHGERCRALGYEK